MSWYAVLQLDITYSQHLDVMAEHILVCLITR
jgi:hypothetical protein